jgi:hypothetical protein
MWRSSIGEKKHKLCNDEALAAAVVTDIVPRLLGRPAISFEQFVQDHRAAFLA